MSNKLDYYGEEMTERRKRFNTIINGIDMVLMNNIPEVDHSIWDNWEHKSPLGGECDIKQWVTADKADGEHEGEFYCSTHECEADNEYECYDVGDSEVFQWFAVNDNDAKFLANHNQYITYSDMLDTYFLAICHCGTAWDYVDSMVDDILGDR